MMSYGRVFALPPVWDDARLDDDRRHSTADFVAAWNAAGRETYETRLTANRVSVERLFDATSDLLTLDDGSALAADPSLTRPARFLGGPPVSEANLDTLAEAKVATRKRLDGGLGRQAARVIVSALDRPRLPWLFASSPRPPTPVEREVAISWTAGLMTNQEVQTALRGESSTRQEVAVERLLTQLGFTKVVVRSIEVTGGLNPGQFCRETHVAGVKCDIPVGLKDGRYLFIECKVSNSGTNSVKRLNRECGGKAAHWQSQFGQRSVTAAVLAGVFKLKNLRDAQTVNGLTLLWEHDLSPLTSFLQAAV